MLLFIIITVFLIFIIYNRINIIFRTKFDWKYVCQDLLMFVLVSIVFTTLYCTIASTIAESSGNLNHEKTILDYEIVSLKNSNQISGSFFIGSGYINNKEYYHVFAKVGDNEYKRKKYKTNNSLIKETTEQKPHVKRKIYTKSLNEFFVPSFCFIKTYRYVIVVPPDTVVKQFKVQ
ncbi:MAG: hypothetical protein ACOC1K_01240 [Nanoarchaeota archaeon]